MAKLNGMNMKLRLGKTQKLIVEHLLSVDGATCTWDLQTSVARYKSGYLAISRAAWRLENRGVAKHVAGATVTCDCYGLQLSLREIAALQAARERHPKAWAFWVLTDAAMNIIGEEPE